MLHHLYSRQILRCDLETAWNFFSRPENLAVITPAWMNFRVLTDLHGAAMYPGQIIEYKVSPVRGVRLHWVTEITQVREKEFFVDEQRFGPYAFWHHKHYFREVPEGVEMIDEVHYKAPLGWLGRVANALFIRRQLQKIFDYRFAKAEELFNGNKVLAVFPGKKMTQANHA